MLIANITYNKAIFVLDVTSLQQGSSLPQKLGTERNFTYRKHSKSQGAVE